MTTALATELVYGSTTPRLWTRPLVTGAPGPCGCGCALSPTTSLGFQAERFATDVLGVTLYPWQRWWLIHALELRPDGRFRFRTIVTLIARQQGKTWLLKVLALWAMYLGGVQLVLGSAQALDIADEAWRGAVDLIEETPGLAAELSSVIRGNGKTCLTLLARDKQGNLTSRPGARYRTAAATGSAGRGLSVGLLILDEVRQHRDWLAWGALSKTTIAVLNSLKVLISNAGDDLSVVLNAQRETALAGTSDSIGIMEWSAPDGCELDDIEAIAQACPTLGHNPGMLEAVADARASDPAGVYRTEILCQRVTALDPPIDPRAWADCVDHGGTLATARDRVALCLDVSTDEQHATLVGAALLADGRVRMEVIKAWTDVDAVRAELVGIVERIKPVDLGWFPSGPAAALGAELRSLRRFTRRRLAKIVTEDGRKRVVVDDEDEATTLQGSGDREACQGLSSLVSARKALHSDDPLLTAHALAAVKRPKGDGWVFERADGGHADAVYAAAGAVYLARMAPAVPKIPKGKVF